MTAPILSFDRDRQGDPTDDPNRTFWIDWRPNGEFMCHNGEIKTKNPDDITIRRMIEMAGVLDAWVVGDDPWIYSIAPSGDVIERQPTKDEIARLAPHYITRGSTSGGFNEERPIMRQEWMNLVTTEQDFIIAAEVDARVPSGIKRIGCPPVATWIGHPARRKVPFFFDDDLVEVEAADTATLHRMIELAAPSPGSPCRRDPGR